MPAGNEMSRVRVQIYGDEYTVKGEIPEKRIRELAALVDSAISEVADSNAGLPRHKVVILAALNMADELLRLREENKELLQLFKDSK